MTCMQTGACNAEVERQQLVWEPAARAVLWTEVHAQCAQGMCSLELLLNQIMHTLLPTIQLVLPEAKLYVCTDVLSVVH